MNLRKLSKIFDSEKSEIENLTYEDFLSRIKNEGSFTIGDYQIELLDQGEYVRLEISQDLKQYVFSVKYPGREIGEEIPETLFPSKSEFAKIFKSKVKDSVESIVSSIINNKITTINDPLSSSDISEIQDIVGNSGIEIQIEPLDDENHTFIVNYF